ncbi:DUF1476 domain-containing protein [Sulfitobacter aestuarii]|uniref:DUF1476 domain-containing protein n=1 Tax=Sulfitobacter aestuarii TaxID=2161676 RepID=A0ABW5U5J9_9RHOB
MTTFDEREIAFENKFAHDAEMQFKASARRDKLIGLWAAGLMGLSGEEAAAYAHEVVRAEVKGAGEAAVYRKLSADLGERADEATIRKTMQSMLAEAKDQLMTEIN